MEDQPKFTQRTDWAEYFVEQLASQPLVSECVYRSPQRTDKTQKEVVDLLLALSGRAMLLSLKCQQDPSSKSPEKEAAWVAKSAGGAVSQIKGALGALQSGSYWCEHPRLGRVEFLAGQLEPIHGVALVESWQPVVLPSDLPLHHDKVPISYFSVHDFCNILQQLRTLPEIEAYLDARRALPLDALKTIGREQDLYQFYLLNNESFAGCLGPDDARLVSSARADELQASLARKHEADGYARLIERVADCLAERNPKYMEGLSEEYQAYFDSPEARANYLKLQADLCDLRLAGRALLGQHFAGTIGKAERAEAPTMTYSSVRYDGKPDFVYALASSRGIERPVLIERARNLLLGAMAFYDKKRGMAIVDRDSVSFEVLLLEVPEHTIAAFHFGEQFFGKLRTSHIPATLVPQPR